jgi:hypothetical protein
MLHGAGIFTYIYLQTWPSLGQYSSTMVRIWVMNFPYVDGDIFPDPPPRSAREFLGEEEDLPPPEVPPALYVTRVASDHWL